MGGISKFQGSKGHNQYEQYGKIRFELPVHGWCLGCGRHIGRVSVVGVAMYLVWLKYYYFCTQKPICAFIYSRLRLFMHPLGTTTPALLLPLNQVSTLSQDNQLLLFYL